MKQSWMEFKAEHLFYFDSRTLESLLVRAGFDQVRIDRRPQDAQPRLRDRALRALPGARLLSARQAGEGACCRTRCCGTASPWWPAASTCWRTRPLKDRWIGGRRKLSVIMPVFNERNTFADVATQLTAKQIPGVEMEFVIVESNSTDGTRDEVRKFEGRPGVKVIYEERPRGKGHGVRTGLEGRDRRLRPDPGRRPRVRPQRLRDPAGAAARLSRRVRARRASRHGRQDLEDAALHRSGVRQPGDEPGPPVLHRRSSTWSTASACAIRSRCTRCSGAIVCTA